MACDLCKSPGAAVSRPDDDFCRGLGLQNHDFVFDDSAQVVIPESVLPTLRPMCKTNPKDDRGQNLETSFFDWKMNISSWKYPGEKTCFYETNPNRENQEA